MTSRSARQRQEDAIVRWLGLFLSPGQVTELRALHAPTWKQQHSFFTAEDIASLASQAVDWQHEGARGVYFTPNPLKPHMLHSEPCATDEDVARRKWLPVDIDTTRQNKHGPASADELKASWNVAAKCRELLIPEGLGEPIVAESGNGWHLCFPIDMPNDEPAKEWCREILHWLHARTKTDAGSVDRSTHNASRIWKLYGTKSQKGEASEGRPHRWAKVIENPQWAS